MLRTFNNLTNEDEEPEPKVSMLKLRNSSKKRIGDEAEYNMTEDVDGDLNAESPFTLSMMQQPHPASAMT